MLHVHNGDSTAGTARKAAIPGEHLAWREALVCGPAPAGLSPEEFRRVRADHLASTYGVGLGKCVLQLRDQEAALSAFADHEEVILWFEHDLFCQVQLIYLLDWFSRRELGQTKLSLIHVGEFPGVESFRGLGQLNEEQLASLFPERQEVSAAQLQLGSLAWQAYCSANPADLLSLLNADLSAIPFLDRALRKHLQRFPSTENGLGKIGNVGLDLIARGYRNFRSLFPAFANQEAEYGFGDSQLYCELKQLAQAPTPLLTLSSTVNGAATDSAEMLLSTFVLTEVGRAVLDREDDFVRRNGIDSWLGGVHLKGDESDYRWEEAAQQLLAKV
jgi:hypothetical protein